MKPANAELKERRKKLKLTQSEAASRLQISTQYYKEIELGISFPGLQLAIRISNEFLVDCKKWER